MNYSEAIAEVKNPRLTVEAWSNVTPTSIETQQVISLPAALALQSECERLREALNRIASWNEGPNVMPCFDEPNSAAIARNALQGAADAK